jgi:hypothetical protein
MSEDDVSRGSHQINLKRYWSPNVNPNAESLGLYHWSAGSGAVTLLSCR